MAFHSLEQMVAHTVAPSYFRVTYNYVYISHTFI